MPDEITRRLVQLILDEGLKPGHKLPSERPLIARLGVGRSSLREAVRSLRAAGVIDVAGGEGMFVGRGEPALQVSPLAWRVRPTIYCCSTSSSHSTRSSWPGWPRS